ncbi:MAG: GAF domain-containing protein [Alcanivorax sp.]|nr:GAF domain-containing protein [Alcanivorax sp.]
MTEVSCNRLTETDEAHLREQLDTLLVRFSGRIEQQYKRHAEQRAAAFIVRSFYWLFGLYLLVVVPVMLWVQDPNIVRWRNFGVYPIAIALLLVWCSSRIAELQASVTTWLGLAVMIALTGTLLGAIYLQGSFASTIAGYETIYILIIAFSILRLPPTRTILCCLAALAVAMLLAFFKQAMLSPLDMLLYFAVPLIVCAVTGYMLDTGERRNFAHTLLLEQESLKLTEWKTRAEKDHLRQQQINAFMEQIAGNLSPTMLMERVMGYLVNQSNMLVGAAYEVRGQHLIRLAAWGLDSQAAERTSQSLSEGLLGGALQREKVSQQDPVPAGYLDLETGHGRYQPASLLFWPLYHAGQPVGIVEIASLEGVTTSTQELLGLLHRPLAYALIAAQRRQRFLDGDNTRVAVNA